MNKQEDSVEKGSKTDLWTRSFLLITFVNALVFLGFNMTITGMPVYMETLTKSPILVSMVTLSVTVTSMFMRPFAGVLIDTYARKGILICGIAIMLVSVAGFAIFPIAGVVLVLRCVQGIGWAMSSSATQTIASSVIPSKRFGEGMGYYSLSTSVATAIAPALALLLLQRSGIVAMVGVAVLAMAVAILMAAVIVKSQIEAHSPAAPHVCESNNAPNTKDKAKVKAATSKGMGKIFAFERRAFYPALLIFLLNVAHASIVTFIAIFGNERGVNEIYWYFTIYAVVAVIIRPLVGKIVDKKGFFWPGMLSMFGMTITMLLIAFSGSLLMFCISGVVAGLGIGSAMALFQTMSVSNVPENRRGAASSTYMFGQDGGMTIGSFFSGLIADSFGYSAMYIICSVFPLIAAISFPVMGRKRILAYSPELALARHEEK